MRFLRFCAGGFAAADAGPWQGGCRTSENGERIGKLPRGLPAFGIGPCAGVRLQRHAQLPHQIGGRGVSAVAMGDQLSELQHIQGKLFDRKGGLCSDASFPIPFIQDPSQIPGVSCVIQRNGDGADLQIAYNRVRKSK